MLHERGLDWKVVAGELEIHGRLDRATEILTGDAHDEDGEGIEEDRPATLLNPRLKLTERKCAASVA